MNETGKGDFDPTDPSNQRIIETAFLVADAIEELRQESGAPSPPRLDSDDPVEAEAATWDLAETLSHFSPEARQRLKDFFSHTFNTTDDLEEGE